MARWRGARRTRRVVGRGRRPRRRRRAGGADDELQGALRRPGRPGRRARRRALHDDAHERLRAAGHARAVLWVFDSNGHARAFYERRGWAPDGERREARWARRSCATGRIPPHDDDAERDDPSGRRPATSTPSPTLPGARVARRARGASSARSTCRRSRTGSGCGTACARARRGWPQDEDGAIVGVVGVANGEIGVLHVEPALADGRRRRRPCCWSTPSGICATRGHSTALLWTFVENQHNRALYERHGWERDGSPRRRCPASRRSATAACVGGRCRAASAADRRARRGDRPRGRALPPARGRDAGRARPEIASRVARAVAAGRSTTSRRRAPRPRAARCT